MHTNFSDCRSGRKEYTVQLSLRKLYTEELGSLNNEVNWVLHFYTSKRFIKWKEMLEQQGKFNPTTYIFS